MGIVSPGFHGRRRDAGVKLPPGQYLTRGFPVLSAGPTPRVPLLLQDEPGFWETAGYHNYGDPWREQRYQGN